MSDLEENANELARTLYDQAKQGGYSQMEIILACNKVIASEFQMDEDKEVPE